MRKFAFLWTMLVVMAFQVGSLTPAQADVVGRLTQVEGRVDLMRGGQLPATPVKIDDGVQTGDVIRTKSQSKAQITFIDNSTLTVSPESRVGIEDYMFDPAQNKRNAVIQLFQGLAHVVVSKVLKSAEPDFVVKTHTAIMGVRGTEFGVRLHPNSSTILNFEGVLQVGNIFPEVGQLSRRALKVAYSFGPPGSSNSVLLRDRQGTMVGRGIAPTMPFHFTDDDWKGFKHQVGGGLLSRKGGRDSGGGEGGTKGGEAGAKGGEGGTASGESGAGGGGYDGGSAHTFVMDQGTAGTGTGTGTPALGSFLSDSMTNNANSLGGTGVGGATIIANTISQQQLQPVAGTPSTTPKKGGGGGGGELPPPDGGGGGVTPPPDGGGGGVTPPPDGGGGGELPVTTTQSITVKPSISPYIMSFDSGHKTATYATLITFPSSNLQSAITLVATDPSGAGNFALNSSGGIQWTLRGDLSRTDSSQPYTGVLLARGLTSGGTEFKFYLASSSGDQLTLTSISPVAGKYYPLALDVTPDFTSPGSSGKINLGDATISWNIATIQLPPPPLPPPPAVSSPSFNIYKTWTALPYGMQSLPNGKETTFMGYLTLKNSMVAYTLTAKDPGGGFNTSAHLGTITWTLSSGNTPLSGAAGDKGTVTATGQSSGGTKFVIPLTVTLTSENKVAFPTGPITGTSVVINPNGADYKSPKKASNGTVKVTYTKTPTTPITPITQTK